MVVSLKDLLGNAEGHIIANLSGGPREIFLAFAIACLAKPEKILKTTSFSDIERTLSEINLPNIAAELDEKEKRILQDANGNQPTTINDITGRLSLSESTISRQVARLADQKALHLAQRGKTKEVRITLTGKILL
jgi:CRISPR-associated protein Csa3